MSDNNVYSIRIEYRDKDSLFTYAVITIEDNILTFNLYKSINDKTPSKILKFNYEQFQHEFKNGYCHHCMFKLGEILPQKIKDVSIGKYDIYPSYVYKVCTNNHVIG